MTLKTLKALLIVATGAGSAAPALGGAGAGAYLAARHASISSDYTKAAEYYTLALTRDPGNRMLLENALIAFVGVGDLDRAAAIARQMQETPGTDSQAANLVLIADLARKEDYEGILAMLKEHSVGPLVDGLVRSWARLGAGRMSEALEAFDEVVAARGMRAFGLYHKGLAIASAGDFEGADRIFSGKEGGPLRITRRGAIAHVQILSQLERNRDALELLRTIFGSLPDPLADGLRARLTAGEVLPFRLIASPREGIAEVFYTVAGALRGEANDGYTLIYSRMAEMLDPGHSDAILLTAQLFDKLQRHDLAIANYKKIAPSDPAYVTAEIGRAEALRRSGRTDAAVEVLEQLAKARPELVDVHVALGDTYRQIRQFGAAARAYGKAIDLFAKPDKGQWFVYYARGIAHERIGEWENAEADFRKALELQPGQPNVLNYLGYSLVEKRIKLDEALAMIRQAVAARPDDGYITDSLGWVLYRLGRYEEAVVHMERAAELMPTDPIVNDHLGDVYWVVGRHREARVQWQRALSFGPEEKEEKRIRRKLEVGLDAVLAAEGASPLAVSRNGD